MSKNIAIFALLLILAHASGAQMQPEVQTQTTSQQLASTSLLNSLQALVGQTNVADVTLTGTVQRTIADEPENGSITLKAVPGAGRMDLSLASGQWSETANVTNIPITGSWTSPDGVSHPSALHNLLTSPVWFFPAFAISGTLSPAGAISSFVGDEVRNNQNVQHVSVVQTSWPATYSGAVIAPLTRLTQMDFYLDSTTFLPAAITFNIHPDNDLLVNIPVEIRFSNYQTVNGCQIPHHIQRFENNGLVLDVELTSSSINTGLSASAF